MQVFFFFSLPTTVLGIRDILVRIRTSWLMDPDPTPDPTSFFSDFKDAKKIFFSFFFLITYPHVQCTLS
jgi:hypothetical protein